jgi:acyl-coenzyme A synthetase/AMP-(fatty) acid ligase
MVPELPITMLACARLGVIHSQVFSGFSGKATADRIVDSESRVLITMDAYYRGGQLLDHKEKADVAFDEAAKEGVRPEKVLVWQRHPGRYSSRTPLVEGRDFVMNEVLSGYRHHRIDPVKMPAEDPLFLMYTSGTTGRPKGCQHSTGGYLSYVAGTSKYIQDIHPEDVYWCMADIGWITGHSYIVYGPLALAASSVVYEGLPTYPDAGRPWRIAEELDVNIFHTSPTAIRALRRAGPDEPLKYNHHFKHMTTVGEPIEPAVWRWYYEVVGKGEAVIVDTWWQTENGGFLCSTVPALHPMKAGSAGRACLGFIRSSMTRLATRFRHAPAAPDTSASRTPGQGHFRRSGRTLIASSNSTTRVTARTERVATGATGRTWLTTAPCRRLTATIASWVESTTSSMWPGTDSGPKRSSPPVCSLRRSPRQQWSPLETRSKAGSPTSTCR